MMHKFRIRLCMLMTVVAFKYTSGDIPAFLRLDTTGCEALLGGSYWQALDALWRQDSIADSGFWNFKKGVAHFNTGDFENAFYCFSFSGKKDSLLSAVSYEYIGDIFGLQKRAREAVEAYFHAQKESLQPNHYQAIRSKIATLLSASPMLIDTLPFLKAWRLDTITTVKEKAEDRFESFDSLVYRLSKVLTTAL